MFGGYLRRIGCRIRPYERIPGKTDEVFREVHQVLLKALLGEQFNQQIRAYNAKLKESSED